MILVLLYVCIYPTPSPRVGCGTRSIFKRSTAGLSSRFLLLDWLPCQRYYLSIPEDGREKMDSWLSYTHVRKLKCELLRLELELWSPIPFPVMIKVGRIES